MQKISVAVILLVAAFLFTSCGHDEKKVVLTPAPTQEESSYVIPSYGTDDSTEIVDISSPAPVSEEAPVDASAPEPPRQEQEAPPPASEAYIQSNYVMIGDSRFVGMQAAIPDYAGFTWIDRVGAGSSLFFEYQDDILSLDRNATVIYALGVNDLDPSGCVEALSALVENGFRHVWFVTTAPVDDDKAASYGYAVTNERIAGYNDAVLQNLPQGIGVIDAYSYLLSRGISTMDGLHYESETYRDWFWYMMSASKR